MQYNADGSVIGHQGMKYGLQKAPLAMGAHQPGAPKGGMPSRPVPSRPMANVFGDDSEEDDVGKQVARQADKKRSAVKVQQIYEAALAEDPTVFDYDGVYDAMQSERAQPRQAEKIARQSRYIAQLKTQADDRKREEDIRFERRLLKDRVVEDAQFEGKEKFVTGAYRRKLEADQKWAASQEAKDAADEKNDVRKVGHMANFYANLLTKNVAMGTAKPAPAPAPASPTDTSAPSLEGEGPAGGEGAEPSQPADGGEARGVPGPAPGSAAAAAQALGMAVTLKPPPTLDRYEQMRVEAERALRVALPQGLSDKVGAAEQLQSESAASTGGAAESATAQGEGSGKQEGEGMGPHGGEEEGAAGAVAVAAAAAAALKRRNDDEAVGSARERYLARKKQHTGS